MIIPVKTSKGQYDIVLKRGALKEVGDYLDLNRKVLVVTDSGVPKEYAECVAASSKDVAIVTIKEGEISKQIDTLQTVLTALVENNFTRTDCIVAVGGGVVGDLSGFAASIYMRGIDFYNIPTTVLSQVDSSIGGKTAIDYMGVKNIVGAFYPPKKVIVDLETLKTLPRRQISNGLAEAVKMAATSDEKLFSLFETSQNIMDDVDTIIESSLRIKKSVVEEDESEKGLRRILNFGHTVGHAIESTLNMQELYHGECVAIGMLYMCSSEVGKRLVKVLNKLNLPTETQIESEKLISKIKLDKKASGEDINIVLVNKIGEFEMKKIPQTQLAEMIRGVNIK